MKFPYYFAALKIRYLWGKSDRKRDKDLSTPPGIVRFDNIQYSDKAHDKKLNQLDVYRPHIGSSLKKLPVIVSIHGGGWIYGSKEVYQYYCMSLAEHGFAVVNYSYRLSPESKFPASVEDTENVFQWIQNNAVQYGFDTKNIFALGDSAGAHILSIYMSALTNPEFAKNFPFIQKKSLKVRAVALNCGVYKVNCGIKINTDQVLLIKSLLKHGGTEEELDLIDTTAHLTKDFPPAFVMSCHGDFLLPQVPFIKEALDRAKIKNEYHCYGSIDNPLFHVFHCNIKLPEAKLCNDDECEFFRRHIK